MTAPDDDAQPDARRPLASRRGSPNGGSTGGARAGHVPDHDGDDAGAPETSRISDEDTEFDAVSRLMAFLREPDDG